MGGVLIVISTLVPDAAVGGPGQSLTCCWRFLRMLAFGAIGFIDDYTKVVRSATTWASPARPNSCCRSSVSIAGRSRIAAAGDARRLLHATDRSVLQEVSPGPGDSLACLRRPHLWPLAFLPFLMFVALVIVGSSNAVNLTDGLDGLAIGCTVIAAGALTVLTYVTSHARFGHLSRNSASPHVGELTVFCGALVGASLGFLWYNAHPAEVFMGDVGSLALGGTHRTDRRDPSSRKFCCFSSAAFSWSKRFR